MKKLFPVFILLIVAVWAFAGEHDTRKQELLMTNIKLADQGNQALAKAQELKDFADYCQLEIQKNLAIIGELERLEKEVARKEAEDEQKKAQDAESSEGVSEGEEDSAESGGEKK